jgi:hypothetical protein
VERKRRNKRRREIEGRKGGEKEKRIRGGEKEKEQEVEIKRMGIRG